ncbi:MULTISPECIES: crossover junction endodeoxyribonuclease RuvC [Cryobacterium]|uniref:crossover junction endodeoxyribonuclease RuvC n=1 Tax=Cryobacterium TaxID=69578 RepID=UPI0015805C06|nr:MULTISPECIES: crossover junction endodeoxyribonuclease RuvC [Cryobacterium]MDY7527934.1 crossover junction endodeoxyribonuclease RuvC [Cryobacterium sp. 10C2]MDY7556304.1 crossover junction endodeoxyribonuclease RuvC [Cryobacterium sp. 10C3]MEB0003732.1 crossover junction endodeoxyribonuclease RuvC [Cryobacterium sp. RTC2.1]MEB0203267.1 crossover junction endodeoxyribonuclease RuvC [Cryobacterium sp. 5I3]MEB0291876.1 crossover junction endodeoxyribonuclease RuvC [Cryobacterium sp. 10C2]
MRVLGIDPGLTRCGVGVVDVAPNRTATLVDVTVLRSSPDLPLEQRLLLLSRGLEEMMDRHKPAFVAIERVFAQHNVRTVMGTAQISGVALLLAAQRGLTVTLHTPSEVKAAITGYGSADKAQVGAMVARVLGLSEVPKPADAADALALAICHAWRTGASGGTLPTTDGLAGGALTPAQAAWRAAERGAAASAVPRRLKR